MFGTKSVNTWASGDRTHQNDQPFRVFGRRMALKSTHRLKFAIGPKIPQVCFSPKNSGDSVVILLWVFINPLVAPLHQKIRIFPCFLFLHFEVHRCYLFGQIFFSQQVWLMSEDLCWLMKGCSILDCWIVCLGTKCPGIAILSCICHIQLFTNSLPTDSWGTFWHQNDSEFRQATVLRCF